MTYRADAATLYENGPLINSLGTGAGGADESLVVSPLTNFGFNHAVSSNYRVTDDFTITNAAGWTIETITFYAYQTNSTTTSTINHVNLRIWDGPPDYAPSIYLWGDTTTNILSSTEFSNIYRASTSGNTQRPIMANTVTVNTTLPAGTYWLDWQTGGTLASGPWVPPITIPGETTTGNAKQFLNSWFDLADTGSGTVQGLPFVITGTVNKTLTVARTGGGDVTVSTGSLSWLGDTGTAYYTLGTSVDLTATASTCSSFWGWGGDCLGENPCSVAMNTDRNATATFVVNKMVRNISSQDEYDLIDTAMNTALDGHVIAARIYNSEEEIDLTDGSVTLIGGYDCDFLGHIEGEMTTINKLTVTGGELTLEYITIL